MRRSAARLAGALALLASACERGDVCPERPELWGSGDLDGTLLRCDRVPELCGLPVESVVREPDLDLAIDVVFVGDGYTDDSLAGYRRRVGALIDEMSADPDSVVGRDPALFNFHRVDLTSPGAGAEDRPLGSCAVDAGSGDSWSLAGDAFRAARAAANAPAVDLVVVLVYGAEAVRGAAGRGIFGTDVVHIPGDGSHRVLTHEIGHALIGLGDEYAEFEGRHYLADRYALWTMNPLPPNLSLSPAGDWGGLVAGAIEGGGRYTRGVYRPTDRCRMLDGDADVAFCPVCSAAIDGVLSSRRGADDGPPRCGIAAGLPGADGSRSLLFFGRDGDGVSTAALELDGDAWPATDLRRLLSPLASRPPLWFEIETSARVERTARVRCTDARGEPGEAVLELSR